MPLKKSSSPQAFKSNLKAEIKAGKPMKQALAIAYSTKRKNMSKGGCAACKAGSCDTHMPHMAEGGMVDAEAPLKEHRPMPGDSEEEHPDREDHLAMPTEHPVDQDYSDSEEDLPKVSESLSLAAEIMKDRKARKFAKGGQVGTDGGPTDLPDDKYETMDSDEMDAPKEDGRDTRGLNLEPVHTMEDDEHDTSDASLVAEILKDRKNRRRGK